MTHPRRTVTASMLRTIIVIPTYNEAENIPSLVAAIREICPDVHVLVADDASPDGTADVAEQCSGGEPWMHVLRRTGPRGYGRACLDGFQYALNSGYNLVLTMDADWSHDPKYLPGILAELEGGADMVVGSRYKDGVRIQNWPLRRVLLSRFSNLYVRAILGLPLADCTSGFRGYHAEALRSADLSAVQSDGYAFLVEIATRVFMAGCSLAESPIVFVDRRAGQSKMSKRVIYESALLPWKLRFTRFPRPTNRPGK